MKSTTHQNVWCAANAMMREKFHPLLILGGKKRSQINITSLYFINIET